MGTCEQFMKKDNGLKAMRKYSINNINAYYNSHFSTIHWKNLKTWKYTLLAKL